MNKLSQYLAAEQARDAVMLRAKYIAPRSHAKRWPEYTIDKTMVSCRQFLTEVCRAGLLHDETALFPLRIAWDEFGCRVAILRTAQRSPIARSINPWPPELAVKDGQGASGPFGCPGGWGEGGLKRPDAIHAPVHGRRPTQLDAARDVPMDVTPVGGSPLLANEARMGVIGHTHQALPFVGCDVMIDIEAEFSGKK